MTPREQADRLFERVMIAHEQDDTAQVAFFLPMTLQAYARLTTLDADARYHLGAIQAIAGRVAAARAQADSLEAEVPGHLFASMLLANAAEVGQDQEAAQHAYQQFLNNFDQEIGSGKPEYDSHRRAIDAFHQEAQRALAERASGR